MGRLVFEGPDGVGKTTALEIFPDALDRCHISNAVYRSAMPDFSFPERDQVHVADVLGCSLAVICYDDAERDLGLIKPHSKEHGYDVRDMVAVNRAYLEYASALMVTCGAGVWSDIGVISVDLRRMVYRLRWQMACDPKADDSKKWLTRIKYENIVSHLNNHEPNN